MAVEQVEQEHGVCQHHAKMSLKIDEIHDALLGTFEKKGIVSQVRELVKSSEEPDSRCPYKGIIRGLCKAMWLAYGALVAAVISAFMFHKR